MSSLKEYESTVAEKEGGGGGGGALGGRTIPAEAIFKAGRPSALLA
jgi:hypothetical protein